MSKNLKTKTAPLGERSKYKAKYDRNLLFPIKRSFAREKMNIDTVLFQGFDIWNCYEISWLDTNGKPKVRVARIVYPHDSKSLIESKSLKLYLNSFNMTKFKTEEKVIKKISKDLSRALKTKVNVEFFKSVKKAYKHINMKNINLIDNFDVEIEEYLPNFNLCKIENAEKAEYEILSNLLKTNCPVTGQPDWGTVHIKYVSEKHILEESLLKYIISFRNAKDFHESCCEKIFTDIYKLINPEKLYVKCYYTRRGGIDINPVRFTGYYIDETDFSLKALRQ